MRRNLAVSVLLFLGIFPLSAMAQLATTYRGDAFRSNYAMILEVPLDTGSVFNRGFPIDSGGYVDLPVVGKIFVHGKSRQEVESFLGTKLAEYLRDTHVLATPAIRLALLGHWQRPGMHYVNSAASVWEAIGQVGGPAGEVNLRKMRVMRGDQDLPINILNEFSSGSTLIEAGVRSGDIFVIPVPTERDGWFWFRESVLVTAQLATAIGTVLTTYILISDRSNR